MNRNYVIISPSKYKYILHVGKKGKYKSSLYYLYLFTAFVSVEIQTLSFSPLRSPSSVVSSVFFLFFCFIFSKVIGPTHNHPSATHPCPLSSVDDEWWPWLKTAVYPRNVLAEWHKINITLFAASAFRKSRNKSKPFTIIKRTIWGQPQRN